MSLLNNFFKFSFCFSLLYQCMISLIPSTNSAIYNQSSVMLCADIIAEKLFCQCYNYLSPSKIIWFAKCIIHFCSKFAWPNFYYYFYVAQVEINFFKRERIT